MNNFICLLNTNLVNTPQELLLREEENYKLQFELINRRVLQMESVLKNIEDRDNNI